MTSSHPTALFAPPMALTMLFDFDSPEAPKRWRSIDDVVMGGVSESEFVETEAGAAFRGTVSLAHGGGFASVRAPESSYDLSEHEGLRLRLQGDGRHYWFTMYTAVGRSVSYRAPIQPPPTWTTVSVRFDELTAYRRGTELPAAPPFDPAQIRTLGFLIADEQEGPFRLDVAWIRAGLDDPPS